MDPHPDTGPTGIAPSGPPQPSTIPLAGEMDRLLLAPPLFLASLVIVLAGTVSLRLPLHPVAVPLAGLLVLIGGVLLWRWRRPRTARLLVLLGLLGGLAAGLNLAEYSGAWLTSPADVLGLHPDNWSYQAMADYLDHYPRGQVDGMPMVDEFGAHLGSSRFATAALLAFFHDLPVFSDVPTNRLVFTLLCLVTHFFSILALSRALIDRANWRMPLLAAFLATAGGWLADAMAVANNDNLIFAALSPALLSLWCARRADRPAIRWQTVLASGVLLGAMLYNYPEGMALLGVLCLPLAVSIVWPGPDGKFRFDRWAETAAGGVLGVLLALPYLPTFVSFLHNQISAATDIAPGSRPGEGIFTGLVGSHRFPAVFALGDEMRGTSYRLLDNLVPLCLAVLVVLGARAIGRRQRWFPWVALPLTALFLWQNVGKHYDYGTFKVLICSAWWVYPAIGAGLFWITERYAWPAAWTAALAAVLLCSVGWQKYDNRREVPPVAMNARIKALQELSTLRFVTGNAPILLALDDDMDHVWATYYLRGQPLAAWKQRGYLSMPHIAPYLARGVVTPPDACQYMLVSGPHADALWQNSRFALLRSSPIYIASVQNVPNGIEMVENERFLWIGTRPATFQIVTRQSGGHTLSATHIGAGPSMGGKPTVTVEITDAQGTHTAEVGAATRGLPIALASGVNTVTLRCLGTPEPGTHNGDPRELMLGIQGPKVAPASPAVP